VIARLNKALQSVEGITLYMEAAQDITVGARVSKTQYQYTLVDVDSDELDRWAPILLNKLQTLPQLTDVASDQQSTGRLLKVEVDRQLAQQLGVNPSVVDSILYDAFGQRVAARYTRLNQYFVILEVERRWSRSTSFSVCSTRARYTRSRSSRPRPRPGSGHC
jgi:multidrug efflux pump subunit AcrB